MSTRVGTLQAPRAGGSILLVAFFASLVVLTIAVVAISVDQGRQGETTFVDRHLVNTPSDLSAGIVVGAEQTIVGGTAANTPSELSGGGGPKTVASGTRLANTPTELSGGIRHKYVSDALGTNTPTEVSGGIILVNGHKRTVPLS